MDHGAAVDVLQMRQQSLGDTSNFLVMLVNMDIN